MINYEDILNKCPIIRRLIKEGWTYTPGKKLDRTTNEPLILSDLKDAIRRLNTDLLLTDIEIENLVEELRLKNNSSKTAQEILAAFREGIPATPKKLGRLAYITLISPNPAQNTYVIADEITHHGPNDTIRCDILLYINGIPLVNIETKDPTNAGVTWADAYRQIRKYEEQVPDLYKYVQIGIAADSAARYFPTTPWKGDAPIRLAEWNIEADPLECLADQLSPATLTNIIKNYTYVRTIKGTDTKVLPRYIQYRASEKIIKRVRDNLAGLSEKNKGLIWHWQGSGKTLTMIYAASILYRMPELGKPTIFFVSDRTDLEKQLISEYKGVKGLPAVHKTTSIKKLIETLKADEYRGRREIMTVLVHKFRPGKNGGLGEFEQIEQGLAKEGMLTVSQRKNIILLIDEAHRTQEGILSGEMRNKILRNAFSFAFTGTPNTGTESKNTFTEFSYPPKEEYLDKYDMGESNKDGFTIELTYQPRLFNGEIEENVTKYNEAIQAFLNLELDELTEEAYKATEAALKKKIKAYKIFLEHPDHIKRVSKDVREHYYSVVGPAGFKAMLICSSRKACALYKEELDREFGDPRMCEVVMTYGANETDETIKTFQTAERTRHPGKTEDQFTERYKDDYLEEEFPKILIVTDKLIAGFDAPRMQTIYLDKAIKGNKLLQAITRCNRPAQNKDYGLIMDYAGIFQFIEKALRNYNRGALNGVILNKKELAEAYFNEITDLKEQFGVLDAGNPKTIEAALKYLLQNSEILKEFQKRFKRLKRVRKFIESTPAVIDTEHLFDWFERLNAAYAKLNNNLDFSGKIELSKIYKVLQENVTVGEVTEDLPDYHIKAEKLPQEKGPVKAVNIAFTLEKFTRVDKYRNPAYESLLQKIERTIAEWKAKNIDDLELCRLGPVFLKEAKDIEDKAEKTDLSPEIFGVSTLIKDKWDIKDSAPLDAEIKTLDILLKENNFLFEGWRQQPTAVRSVEKEIKRLIRRFGKAAGKTTDEIDELFDMIAKGLE